MTLVGQEEHRVHGNSYCLRLRKSFQISASGRLFAFQLNYSRNIQHSSFRFILVGFYLSAHCFSAANGRQQFHYFKIWGNGWWQIGFYLPFTGKLN